MKNRKGFTIVELVIVIAVIAILAAVLIPTFSGVVSKANQSGALQEATSAMKSTLAMSDYGTITENTQFIIVNGEKVAYRFTYSGNQIKEIKKGDDLPNEYNSIIVRGYETIQNQVKTYIANNEDVANLISVALDETIYVSQISVSSTDDFYTLTLYKTKGTNETATHKFDSSSKSYVQTNDSPTHLVAGTLKIFINADYPDDIVTVTKSN